MQEGCTQTLPGSEGVAQDDCVKRTQPLLRRILPERGLAAPQHPALLIALQAHHLRRTPAAVTAWVAAGATMQRARLQAKSSLRGSLNSAVDDRVGCVHRA